MTDLGITPSLKFSPQEREWMQTPAALKHVSPLKVPAGYAASPSVVNGLSAAAQWGYKLGTSTRPGGKPPKGPTELQRAKAKIAQLEAEIAQLKAVAA